MGYCGTAAQQLSYIIAAIAMGLLLQLQLFLSQATDDLAITDQQLWLLTSPTRPQHHYDNYNSYCY